jgi:hypothetical protein
LRLAVSELGDWHWDSGCSLWLPVRDLGDWLGPGGASWLPVRLLADGTAGNDADEDGLALSGPVAVVQVIEGSAQTFVEDS